MKKNSYPLCFYFTLITTKLKLHLANHEESTGTPTASNPRFYAVYASEVENKAKKLISQYFLAWITMSNLII